MIPKMSGRDEDIVFAYNLQVLMLNYQTRQDMADGNGALTGIKPLTFLGWSTLWSSATGIAHHV